MTTTTPTPAKKPNWLLSLWLAAPALVVFGMFYQAGIGLSGAAGYLIGVGLLSLLGDLKWTPKPPSAWFKPKKDQKLVA